ncbi:MAG: hypothetical protein HC913_00475 [Microscillaceae bacterium]|nr:hypothetical protein [Microscillaceae bacterium]
MPTYWFIWMGLSCSLSALYAQSPEEYRAIFARLEQYETQHLQPVFSQQRQKLNAFLSEEDKVKVYELSQQYLHNQDRRQSLFREASLSPAQKMAAWENLQTEIVWVETEAKQLAEKYADIIHQLCVQELTPQILRWRTDMNLLLYSFNQNRISTPQRLLAKYGFGNGANPCTSYFGRPKNLCWPAKPPPKRGLKTA